MSTPADLLLRSTAKVREILPLLDALAPRLDSLARDILTRFNSGHKLLTCGNGGSAADAMHLAEELTTRFRKTRRALPALALLDPTAITCAGNDFGFDHIFSRQVEALGQPGDLLVVFTTSGNSPNILAAVQAAHTKGLATAAFLGKDGGKLKGVCTHELLIPAQTTDRIQEAHLILYHTLCEWIDSQVD
jgi:D-sedoheptulose 7-phosphate isomerase